MAMASAPSDSSQSGRSWPRRSAIASAHFRLWWMLDDPVSSAPSSGSSPRHAISPVSRWKSSAKSMAASTVGHSCRRYAVSPVIEVVVPRAGGDVTGDVGVEGGVLDLVAEVVGVPSAVGALHAGEPVVARHATRRRVRRGRAPSRLRPCSTDRCARRGTTGCCRRASWIDAMASTVSSSSDCGDDAVDVGQHVLAPHQKPTFCVYTTRLFPSTGLSNRSIVPTHLGCCTIW